MSNVCVIPARYSSSRFPGKPLAMIGNKPVVAWVYGAAKNALGFDEVIVATDDERILKTCVGLHIPCMMTSTEHKTGTDRVAEAAKRLEYADIIVNLQGDEPFVKSSDIAMVLNYMKDNPSHQVVNCITKITDPAEVICTTVPKVVVNGLNEAMYLSRSPMPYPQGKNPVYYKQVCIYGFRKKSLLQFTAWPRGPLETAEDIEILRFIENRVPVQMLYLESSGFAIDTPKDLARARQFVAEGRAS